MSDNLKRYLLYCHSLVFEDPLPYLLDYFEPNIETDTALRRIPAVNALLAEYADLKQLITSRILLPISHPAIILNELPVLDKDTQKDLEKRLPNLPSDVVDLLAHKIIEEQYRRRRFNNNVDLFFPHTDYVLILRELLKLEQKKFASTAVSEPFGLAVLGSISALNPRALSTADLVRIRVDDELFSEWRAFLSRVFREIQVREHTFTSVEAEFVVALSEEFLSWRDRFDARLKRGSIKAAFSESGTHISIGMVAGGITGMLGGGTTTLLGALAGGVLGGLVQPAIELAKNIVNKSVQRADALSLRHHFLAVGILDSKGRVRR